MPPASGRKCGSQGLTFCHPGAGPWTQQEDALIVEAQARLGNKWTDISRLLGGPPWRTDNAIKNRWNTHLNPRRAASGDKDGVPPSAYSSDSASATRSVSPALSTASSSWATSAASDADDEPACESPSSSHQHALLRSSLSKLLGPESSASQHVPSTPTSIPPSPTPARMEVSAPQAASSRPLLPAHSPAIFERSLMPSTADGTSGVSSVIMRVQEQNRKIQQLQQQRMQQQQQLMRTLRERQQAQVPAPAAWSALCPEFTQARPACAAQPVPPDGSTGKGGRVQDAAAPQAVMDPHDYPMVQFPEPPRDFGLGSPMECCTPEARSPQMNAAQLPRALAGQLARSPLARPVGGNDEQDDVWDDLDEWQEQQQSSHSERAEEQRWVQYVWSYARCALLPLLAAAAGHPAFVPETAGI